MQVHPQTDNFLQLKKKVEKEESSKEILIVKGIFEM